MVLATQKRKKLLFLSSYGKRKRKKAVHTSIKQDLTLGSFTLLVLKAPAKTGSFVLICASCRTSTRLLVIGTTTVIGRDTDVYSVRPLALTNNEPIH